MSTSQTNPYNNNNIGAVSQANKSIDFDSKDAYQTSKERTFAIKAYTLGQVLLQSTSLKEFHRKLFVVICENVIHSCMCTFSVFRHRTIWYKYKRDIPKRETSSDALGLDRLDSNGFSTSSQVKSLSSQVSLRI
jgi:hypothetical protein